jgi:hypothetical protein
MSVTVYTGWWILSLLWIHYCQKLPLFTDQSLFHSCWCTIPTLRKGGIYPQVRRLHLVTTMRLHHVQAPCEPWSYGSQYHYRYASKGPDRGCSGKLLWLTSGGWLTRTEYCLPARIHGDSVRLKARSVAWSRLLILFRKPRSVLYLPEAWSIIMRTSMKTVPFCDSPLQKTAGWA